MRFTSRFERSRSRYLHLVVSTMGLAALVMLLAAAAGCGSEPTPQPPPAQEPAQGQSEQPASGGQGSADTGPEMVADTGAETGAGNQADPAPAADSPSPTVPEPTAATEAETPTDAAPATAQPGPGEAAPTEPAGPAGPAGPTVAAAPTDDGGALVIGEGSKATFTVNEKLAWLDLPNDAVMLTEGLSGSIYLDGRASVIELDLHSMTSDSDRRDGYVRNRMFPEHRVATFTVADLGDLPDPLPEGEVISREVRGELSIQEVTKPVVFEVEARRDPDKLFILGRTTFTWDDLEIPPPNIPGRIQVKDEVQVEVLLSATPPEG